MKVFLFLHASAAVLFVFAQAKTDAPTTVTKSPKTDNTTSADTSYVPLDYEIQSLAVISNDTAPVDSPPPHAAPPPGASAGGGGPVGTPGVVGTPSPNKKLPLKRKLGAAPVLDARCKQADIDKLKKRSAFLAKQYTDDQLGVICKKEQNWHEVADHVEQAQRRVAASPVPGLTIDQAHFIDHIRSCAGIDCFQGEKLVAMPPPLPLNVNFTGEEPETDGAPGLAGVPGPQPAPAPGVAAASSWPRVRRKEYRTLTDYERYLYHWALNALKTSTIDGISKYDLLVSYHAPSTSPSAHWGCSFLPWHREFLKQLEVALRLQYAPVFLPYWDSSLDKGLPTPCDSVFFSDDFMGDGSSGRVTNGPFANWRTTSSYDGSNEAHIFRKCGNGGDLFSQDAVTNIMSKTSFKDFCYCNDPVLESVHGMIHNYVGGHMTQIPLAPNDPLFFMHHCFVDYIWEDWREKKQTRAQRPVYPADYQVCGKTHYGDSPLLPFKDLKVKDGMSNIYTDELYDYEERPSCQKGTCYGDYLYCNKKVNPPRCLSKIRKGGNCKGFEGEAICAKSNCVSGKCV